MHKYAFDGITHDCTSNSCHGWQKVSTILGTCCSFNYYPIALPNVTVINQAGKFSGIQILFSSKKLPTSGLSLIISYAGEYITPYDNAFKLFPGFDNYFRLDLEKIIPHPQFKRLSMKSRRCVLPTDGTDAGFYRSWCTLICIVQNIYQECDCHPFNLPVLTQKSASMRKCTVDDLRCFREKYDGKVLTFCSSSDEY